MKMRPATAPTSNPAATVLRGLASMITDARAKPMDIEHLAAFFDRGGHQSLAWSMLLELIPCDIDGEQWSSWLEGGEPPRPIELRDPAEHQKPSPTGAQDRARRDRDKAACEVDRVKARLAEAEEVLAARNAALRAADDQVRGTMFYQAVRQIIRQAGGAFAMGPCFTIMRAISPHLQEDILYKSGLDADALSRLETRRNTRASECTETLDLLDRHCGDIVLELNLQRAILKVLRTRHTEVMDGIKLKPVGQKLTPFEQRVSRRRTTEEQRKNVREDAPRADRIEVFDALTEALDEIRASQIP